jgi:uncharacterized membrane protein
MRVHIGSETESTYRPATAAPRATESPRVRLDSVDLLRGVIMILMALDHTRDFFGDVGASPTNLATTTAPLFFTRWITHFCAPVFFLLTGTGAYLARRRRSTRDLSHFLLTRGLWLIFLELVVCRFFWQFNVDYQFTVLTVLWAIGWSMVVLAALVYLPSGLVGALGAAMILLHDVADGVRADTFGALAPLWTALHGPGVLYAGKDHLVFAAYPLIPWVGVVAAGYGLGRVFTLEPERRRSILLRAGVGLTIGFVLLRATNLYGDPRPWSVQGTAAFTWLSFLNTSKYPPSLLFLMMTLGPALLFLRAVDGRTPRFLRSALAFGRVPMFYYLMHVLVLHLLAVAACLVRYGSVHWMYESQRLDQFPVTQPPGWPAPLPVVYLIWAAVVLILYPCCRWYAALKARRSDPWLSYL